MRIQYKDSHGVPAFSVEAENEQDKEIISTFINFERNNQDYKFWMHSSCFTQGKTISFYFGYANPKEFKKYLKKESVFKRVWKAMRKALTS
jgi:hypothetical protein